MPIHMTILTNTYPKLICVDLYLFWIHPNTCPIHTNTYSNTYQYILWVKTYMLSHWQVPGFVLVFGCMYLYIFVQQLFCQLTNLSLPITTIDAIDAKTQIYIWRQSNTYQYIQIHNNTENLPHIKYWYIPMLQSVQCIKPMDAIHTSTFYKDNTCQCYQ